MNGFSALLEGALARREALLARLSVEGTDCWRIFHGISEGRPGLTVDRYGPLLLVQTFRESLSPAERDALEGALRERIPQPFSFVYNHRGRRPGEAFERWHRPAPEALAEVECREAGVRYLIRPRHRGSDPWLFLDLRAGRRRLRAEARGRSVLNLFAYTCSAGAAAAAAGAAEVLNIDFAASSLEVGLRNARLNGLDERSFATLQEDCLPAMRQLAGLPPGGRRGKAPPARLIEARRFDWVFLDPPAWSKGSRGAVDVAGDYPTLFKPALLAAKAGGRVLATNHVASVSLEAWVETLRRCAEKAGRPLRSLETLGPDDDFPAFDGRPPLKIAVCEV